MQYIYTKNAIIFSKRDDSDGIYTIIKGSVKVFINNKHGKEIILNSHGPGEYFGEMALLDGGLRSATIITKEPSEFIIFTRDDLKKILAVNPDIALTLLKNLSFLLRRATRKIENLTFLDVYGRVIRILQQLGMPQGDEFVIKEKITHQEIANMVGTTRETVSRVLNELIADGHIISSNKQIIIHKDLFQSI